jgi:hypothetical protein
LKGRNQLNKKVNKKLYKKELEQIEEACIKFGGSMEISDIDYELARYKSDHGMIIFYQYKSSAGNHAIRQRISNLINDDLIDVVMWLMMLENNTDFSVKNISSAWNDRDIRYALKGRR